MTADVDTAIRILNEALAAEPEAITAIFACRPKLKGDALKEHPTIQVGECVSALGLLNGIFGVRPEDGWGYITARWDDSMTVLQGFERTDGYKMDPTP